MAGLTATGITIKDVAEILTDIESEQIANIDADLNVGPDDVLGQLNGIYAAALAELWELFEEIYQSAYPDTASGQSLSYVAALTGSIRQVATKAELTVNLVGVVDTVVPAGTRFYPEDDPDSLFQTTAPATILEQGATDFVVVTAQAVTEGSATTAADGDTLVIATPVSGLNFITTSGVDPLNPGVDEETDAELRTRREQSLALAGASTVEAIRSDMLTVTGVDTCTVFENPTGDTDAQGLPPNSIEVLVSSTAAPSYDTEEVVQQIWDSKPAGTETYGALNDDATDSQGNLQTIKYSEPTTVRLYVAITLTAATDGTYIGDTDVEQAVEDWSVANLQVGQSVYASDLINLVADLTGVVSVDVGATFVEAVDATPDTVEWIASARELGEIDAADVTVTS